MAEYQIPGFHIESENLLDKSVGRGLVIYVQNNLSYTKLDLGKIVPKDDIPDEVLACEINLSQGDKLLLCVFYRSPSSSEDNSRKINELMRRLISLNHSHVLMVGDYNYPKIDWTSYTSDSKHEDINFEFIECVRDCYMHQHVTTPTRGRGTETPSVLDLVFSNEAELVEGVTTNAPLGASDHSVLEIDFRCHPGELPPKVSYSYEKADFKKMRDMMDIDWEKILGDCEDDVNTQWEIFHNKYKQAEEACVPKRILKTSKKKFSVPLDKRTLAKKRRKHRLWQRFLETEDGKVYTEYRRCSNQLRRLTRKATKIFEKGIAKSAKTQPKKFWKYVSSKTKAKNKIPDLYMDDNCDPNNMAKTDEEKAESLATFFSSVFTKELDGMWEL